MLKDKLMRDSGHSFDLEYKAFIEVGGDEDNFEGFIDHQKIQRDASTIIDRLKLQEPAKR